MAKEYELVIKGFKTKAAATAFAQWFDGQGEQCIGLWFDAMRDNGDDVGETPRTKAIKDEGDLVILTVRN